MAMAATKMSPSEMSSPCSLSEAYISAALTITSSVIGRTVLCMQNLLKASFCFWAFFAFNPLRISYLVMWDIVRRLCSRIYSAALVLTRVCPLKSSERMSVSRSERGYISQLLFREKRLLSNAIFSIASMSSEERPSYTIEARERILEGFSNSSSMMRVTLLCSGISRGDTGFKTPPSNIASTVLGIVNFSSESSLTKDRRVVNKEKFLDYNTICVSRIL